MQAEANLEVEERFALLKAPCKLPSVRMYEYTTRRRAAYNLKPLLLFLFYTFFFTFRLNNTYGGIMTVVRASLAGEQRKMYLKNICNVLVNVLW